MPISDYQSHGLYLHNWYRKRHGSPKMTLSERLNNAADAYAYKLACRRALAHTSGLDYNENLYMSWDRSKTKKQHVYAACELWYDEKKYYNYSSGGFSMQTGHFTAMVWKNSVQLGIGYGEANGTIVICACYKPHANGSMNFRANVLPYRSVEDSDDEEEKKKETKVETKSALFKPDMEPLAKRLETYSSWPSSCPKSAKQLAKCGFYYTGEKDKVICFNCGTSIFELSTDSNAWLSHAHHSRNQCSYLATHDEGDKEAADVFNRYMTTLQQRLDTYDHVNFTAELTKKSMSVTETPKQFAECGFYYTGKGDRLDCFRCGIVIFDWEAEENVWTLHEHHSVQVKGKICPFLTLNQTRLDEEKAKVDEAEKASKTAKSTKSTNDDGELDPKIKERFAAHADESGAISAEGLESILNEAYSEGEETSVKTKVDKRLCALLISLCTLRSGEKSRINLEEFEAALGTLQVIAETGEKFDADNSESLDPFELKEALEHSGFHVGYKTFATLRELFCEGGTDSMGEEGFALCYVLLSKLQIVREKATKPGVFEDFCLKDWIKSELEKASQ